MRKVFLMTIALVFSASICFAAARPDGKKTTYFATSIAEIKLLDPDGSSAPNQYSLVEGDSVFLSNINGATGLHAVYAYDSSASDANDDFDVIRPTNYGQTNGDGLTTGVWRQTVLQGSANNVTVTANNSTDETVYPLFADGATGGQGAESDTGLTYNPSTGVLMTEQFASSAADGAHYLDVVNGVAITAATTAGFMSYYNGEMRIADGTDYDDYFLRKEAIDTEAEFEALLFGIVVPTELTAHTGAASDAHAGTAISNTPAGNIAATTVQAALNELDSEKSNTAHDHAGTYEPADAAIAKTDEAETLSAAWNLGAPTATTPASDDNDTSVATTAYVQTELSDHEGAADPHTGYLLESVAEDAAGINTGTATDQYVTADALAGSNLGSKEMAWTIYDSDTDTATGDGKQAFVIPATMNGMNVIDVTAAVHSLNSATGGTTTVMLRRVRGATAADMLTTGVTISYNEYSASDETVNATNDDLQTGDKIYVDVDATTTGAAQQGLSVTAVCRLP